MHVGPTINDERAFPNYSDPPVVETVLSVQFEQLAGFTNGHLGAFWRSLPAEDWQTVSDAAPLPEQMEEFSESAPWASLGPRLSLFPPSFQPSRLQIKNKNGDRMIQVQNGRLTFNWLGTSGSPYPRYGFVRDEGFLWALKRFSAFLGDEKLGAFRPNQWEVIYLNHIPRGTVWHSPADWGFFRLLPAVRTVDDFVRCESFSGTWRFVIPDDRGRLYIQWQSAHRSEPDERDVIVLTLTARGPLPQGDVELQSLVNGLDLGRKAIVCSFKEFVSDEANSYWGLNYGTD